MCKFTTLLRHPQAFLIRLAYKNFLLGPTIYIIITINKLYFGGDIDGPSISNDVLTVVGALVYGISIPGSAASIIRPSIFISMVALLQLQLSVTSTSNHP